MFAFLPTALWALGRGGPQKLWLTFGAALSAIILLALAMSKIFEVPNQTRLLLFMSALGGSPLLCATILLHLSQRFRWGQSVRAVAAVAGCMIGLVGGILLAVYGLRPL